MPKHGYNVSMAHRKWIVDKMYTLPRIGQKNECFAQTHTHTYFVLGMNLNRCTKTMCLWIRINLFGLIVSARGRACVFFMFICSIFFNIYVISPCYQCNPGGYLWFLVCVCLFVWTLISINAKYVTKSSKVDTTPSLSDTQTEYTK